VNFTWVPDSCLTNQPIFDRAFDASPVFISARARAQERQIDQFYREPLIPIGVSSVGQLDELASSLVGVSKDAISGEFHSHLAR
jgi:hypothetical protein